jgi:hypothetical protein
MVLLKHGGFHEEDAMDSNARATLEELYKIEGKADLINGEIMCMAPTGGKPGDCYEFTHARAPTWRRICVPQ